MYIFYCKFTDKEMEFCDCFVWTVIIVLVLSVIVRVVTRGLNCVIV